MATQAVRAAGSGRGGRRVLPVAFAQGFAIVAGAVLRIQTDWIRGGTSIVRA